MTPEELRDLIGHRSQRSFAREHGINESTLNRWLSGQRGIPKDLKVWHQKQILNAPQTIKALEQVNNYLKLNPLKNHGWTICKQF